MAPAFCKKAGNSKSFVRHVMEAKKKKKQQILNLIIFLMHRKWAEI